MARAETSEARMSTETSGGRCLPRLVVSIRHPCLEITRNAHRSRQSIQLEELTLEAS